MSVLIRPWGHMHYARSGRPGGVPILFLNSLGTDLRMWDGVKARLEGEVLGLDKPGHGLSARPSRDLALADLVADALALLDHLGLDRVLVAGCSVGGLVAQGLALQDPDRVAGLFLSNTAARIGTPQTWADRIAAVQAHGLEALAPQILERWFPASFRQGPEVLPWQSLVERGDGPGYVAICRVLAGADLTDRLSAIACPTLCLAGSADLATPPDLVAATAAGIPGARFHLLEGAGHVPAIDQPEAVAALLARFRKDIR